MVIHMVVSQSNKLCRQESGQHSRTNSNKHATKSEDFTFLTLQSIVFHLCVFTLTPTEQHHLMKILLVSTVRNYKWLNNNIEDK